jgi:hypothetical protein
MANMKNNDPSLTQNELLSILNITRAITLGDLDLPSAIHETLRFTTDISGADINTLFLLDKDTNELSFAGQFNAKPYKQNDVGFYREPVVKVAKLAVETQLTIILNNVREVDDYNEWRPEDILSVLVVPIKIVKEVIGILILESSKEVNFDGESVQIIEIFASLLGVALGGKDLASIGNKTKRTSFINTTKDFAFVLMPFREPFNKYYQTIYRPAIEAADLRSLRVDEIFGPSSISQDIWDNINKAKVVIAELSTRNPNVMYELGLSHAVGKQVIMIAQTFSFAEKFLKF